MSKLFFKDGTFACPQHVTDLDKIPEEWRSAYAFQNSKNRWRMRDHIWHEIAPLAAQLVEAEAKLADLNTSYEKMMGGLTKGAINDALEASLKQAGVKQGLLSGAVALLKEAHAFDVDRTGETAIVFAATDYGAHPIETVVSAFLESEDGHPFLGAALAPADGHFSSLVADLEKRR